MSSPDPLAGAPDLAYREGALMMEDVGVAGMAERVGTPFYAYSSAYLERRYRAFMAAFGGEALLCFAVKANSNLSVLRHLGRLGAGADLVSEGELRRALAAAIPPKRLIFSGVGKTEAELSAALAADVHQINVESEAELRLLSEVAQRVGRTARIAIRVNPDVDANTHAKIATGRSEDKFGIDLAVAPQVLRRAKELPRLEPVGLAVHIGSQITRLEPFETAFTRVVDLLKALRGEGMALTRLDLGGGLGIRYKDETPPSLEDYAALVKRVTRGLGLELAFEHGRWIAADAGILVSRVLYVKEGPARRFVVVDAAMNDLMRPALYGAWHGIVPVAAPHDKAPLANVDVVGPVCETGDVFAAGRPLPPLVAGDLVAFLSAGAYGAIMSSGYNSRLLVPEVMVRAGEFTIVRRRPTYDEMLAQERVPLWLL